MTITKEQLDTFIERLSDELYDGASKSNQIYRAGAAKLAPLLLQACEALAHRWPGETGFHVSEFYRHTLSQIEATINNTGKDTK